MEKEKNQKKKSRREKKGKHKVLKAFIILFIILAVLCGLAYGAYIALINGGAGADMLTKMFGGTIRRDPVYVLILGVNPPLSDTIMLVGYDPNSGKASVLSVPRDTYIDDVVTNKINAVYSTNGGYKKDSSNKDYEKAEKAMLSQVEEITGIYADYYITLDTKALVELVDAIGGVTVDVPINMKYDDSTQNLHINLQKGVQKLDGKHAEQFVRFRKNNNGTGYTNGDIGRVAAQQEFVKALMKEVLQPKNITKINDLIQIGLDNVKTNITFGDALQYVDDIKKFNMDNLRMETLPQETDPIELKKYRNANQACYFWDKDGALKLATELFSFKEETDTDNEQIENAVTNEN